jgi:membrane-associated phospholipid phosphatase
MDDFAPPVPLSAPDLSELSPVARVSLPIRALPTRRLQAARVVSDVLNPQWLSIPLFFAVAWRSTETAAQALAWWAVCLGLIVVPGRLFVRRGLRRRRFSDREVSVRSQRTPLYLFGLTLLALTVAVMAIFRAPRELVAAIAAMLCAALLGLFVNLRWKISVHGGAVATSGTLLTLLFGPALLALALPLVLAIGWSRVVLQQHTPAQVAAGAGLCSTVTLVVFRLFGLI